MVKVKFFRPVKTLEYKSRHLNVGKIRGTVIEPTRIKWGRNELFVIPYEIEDVNKIVTDAISMKKNTKNVNSPMFVNRLLLKTGVPSLIRLADDLSEL